MKTLHLISHTHWDREWYLPYQQFRLKLVHLIDNLLDLLANDPKFKYFLLDGQIIILEDYLQIRPDRAGEISEHINSGRILIGPWYISPDEFLVGPEAHIRNLLEGDRISRKFGDKMRVGYLPDSFGHISQMPQILQGFGIKTACVWRGLDDQPCELIWSAPNGSSVLMAYLRDSYSNAASLSTSDSDKFAHQISDLCNSLDPYTTTDQILLMHGTDHMEPPIDLSSALLAYRKNSEADILVHSTLPDYLDAVQTYLNINGMNVPVITGELRSSKRSPLLANVLSTRMWLKQRNHTCETLLVKWAEPFNAWAHFIHNHQSFLSSRNVNHGSLYQAQHLTNNHEILREAWRILMQCHPHDSICGCSIDQVADEMRPRFDQVEQIGEEITIQSLHLIAGAIDTLSFPNFIQTNNHPKITSSIVVFNPNDSIQTGLVKVNLIPAKECNSFEIIDETGKPLSYQQSGMGSRELINMILDQKGFKNALGMIHEGRAAGMVIRDFEIHRQGNQAVIEATISDSGEPDMKVWRQGLAQVEAVMADPVVDKYIIRAYSNPDICVSFIARDIPGHGYRTFWISDKTKPNSKPSTPMKIIPLAQKLLPLVTQVSRIPLFTKLFSYKKPRNAQPPYKIENEFFIVKAHATEGTLTVIDKRNNQEFSGLNRMVDGGDCGDEYNYCPPDHDIKISAKLIKVYSKQDSVHQSLEIHYQLIVPLTLSDDRKSRSREKVKISVISNITVIPGVPRIDIRTEIDNHAHDHRLRVHFPAPFDSSHSIHDGHFDIIQRSIELPNFDESWVEPPRPEVPQRAFTCVTNGHSSLTIANRGIPEVEVLRNNLGNVELALTLLRCVGWLSRDDFPTRKGHAGPMGIATPGAQMQGKYTFDYSIIPQTADWHDSMDQAYAFNTPFRAVNSKIHSGFLPYQASMIEVQNKYFIITTTKLSEDQSSMVVRGFNSLSHPIDIVLKTWKPFIHAQLINMSEQVLDELNITPDGYVNDHVNGHEIRTFKFSY